MDSRTTWKRVLSCVLAYVGLLFCWPLARLGYAPAFRAGAQLVVRVVHPLPFEMLYSFEPGASGAIATDLPHVDTTVRMHLQGSSGSDATFGASSFFHGYHPSAVLLALFLAATPLAWCTRRRRLLWALLTLHAFFALRCSLAVYYAYARSTIDGRPAVGLSPLSMRALYWIWHFAWEEPLATYLVPLVIWVPFAFLSPPETACAPSSSSRPRQKPATSQPTSPALSSET